MKISTEIYGASLIVGEERAVELIAKAGFDAFDFTQFRMCSHSKLTDKFSPTDHALSGPNYLRFARKIKQIGLDNGIVCNQSHAPYPSRLHDITYLKRSIECAAEVDAKILVIHPNNNETPQKNAELYNLLLPFAKQHNVKIATENMWNWDKEKGHSSFAACATPKSFNEHLDAVNDEFLVACLDIGHAEMKGSETSAKEMILALGNRLKALHIHDNDKLHDLHALPFTMQINFSEMVEALKEIGYNGDITLEANRALEGYTSDNVFEGLKKMSAAAKRLLDMF